MDNQSDDALVEELARALWIGGGNRAGIWDGTEGVQWTAYGEKQKPEWRKLARAILPIIHAREAAAKADAEMLAEALEGSQLGLTVLADMLKRIGLEKGEKVAVEIHRNNTQALAAYRESRDV